MTKEHKRKSMILAIVLMVLMALLLTSCQFEITSEKQECERHNRMIDKEIENIIGHVSDDTCIKSKEHIKEIQILESKKC